MKKLLAVCLMISLALSMAACQATPEKNIVQGKNLDKMIEDATKTQAPGSSAEAAGTQGGSIAEKMGAPATFTGELTDGTGKVKIHVNADVEVPDATGVTVQRVERGAFSQDTVDILKNQLVRGGNMFSGDDYKPTKGEIQAQILAIQAQESQSGGTEVNPKIGAAGHDTKDAYYQMMLQDLQKQLETAPDTHTETPITGQLQAFSDGFNTGQKVYGLVQPDAGGYESFSVTNYDAGGNYNAVDYTSERNGFSRQMGFFASKDVVGQTEAWGGRPSITSEEIAQIPDISITADEAKQKADALISALGINDMICVSEYKEYGGSTNSISGSDSQAVGSYLNPRKCVWYLRYERSVNGIPVTYTAWDCMKVEGDSQAQPWSYEDMTFAIDDSGIVGFNWHSPYNVTDTVTQNSNVLSFSDVTQVFNTMAVVQNAWDGYANGNPDLTGIDITIDHIKFGLTRVTEQNKRDSGLLVPVWDFFGTVNYISQKNGQTVTMPDGPVPVLTVNAIDGSIINRSLGY